MMNGRKIMGFGLALAAVVLFSASAAFADGHRYHGSYGYPGHYGSYSRSYHQGYSNGYVHGYSNGYRQGYYSNGYSTGYANSYYNSYNRGRCGYGSYVTPYYGNYRGSSGFHFGW